MPSLKFLKKSILFINNFQKRRLLTKPSRTLQAKTLYIMKIKLYTLVALLFCTKVWAQDDLLDQLEKQAPTETNYTTATFKGSRLMNGQTVETIAKKHLNMWIQHRFGRVNSGFDGFYGLDESRVRIGFDYGVSDRLMVGIGRSSFEKTADYFAKYKLLRQSTGNRSMPITATLLVGGAINTAATGYTTELGNTMKFYNNTERQSYFGQLIIGRKFSEGFSLQLMPTLLHNNKTESNTIDNNLAVIGIGGRMKLTKRTSFNAEYYSPIEALSDDSFPYKNSLAIGFDIETGGHVFQLHFTNSRGMIEKQYIAGTAGQWSKGDIHYGFNVSRVFSLDPSTKKKK
jgi:hypothetical protein